MKDVEHQNRFQTELSCTDHIFTLKQVTGKRLTNLEIHVVFTDLDKAHGSVPLRKFWETTSQQGFDGVNVNGVKRLYENTRVVYTLLTNCQVNLQ